MPTIANLIAELSAATNQMQQAAIGGDWAMAEIIQKRRAVLIARIVEHADAVTLTAEETHQLSAVREQEAMITARTTARHQALGKRLAETHGVRLSRMEKAYAAGL